MPGMKDSALLMTGDDFGVSHQVNEAIEAQYLAGRLTQTSLMIHGGAVEEAVRIARRDPQLGVGLHLTLVGGTRPGRTVLTDVEGRFPPNPAMAGWRYFYRRELRGAIRLEIIEQFGLFLERGFLPVYWDDHMHLHLHPVVFQEAESVAKNHGFRAVRLLRTQRAGCAGMVFNILSCVKMRHLDVSIVHFPCRVWGFSETGRMNDACFARAVKESRGVALGEIYYHPGMDGPVNYIMPEEVRRVSWRSWPESDVGR